MSSGSAPVPARSRRPTREETRTRLLDAAARVFIERGIAAASVEEITEAAGFSRGAFYSNFDDKDALVLALLQRLTDASMAEIEDLLERYPDPDEYIRATQEMIVSPTRRAGNHDPVLSIELVLYALRNPAARPLLKERLDRAEAMIWRVVERNATALGLDAADNRRAIAAMIVAMDDGFALHSLVDPARDSIELFSTALDFLGEAGAAIAFTERHGGPGRAPTRPSARRKPPATRT
jgi:AcrR family transcriptional regulator